MSALTPFNFESRSIRVLTVDGLPHFVAKDVMLALEYADASTSNISAKIAHVPDEWKGRHPMATLGGEQELWCLSEPGLYFFVNRSDKPKALPFQKWVAGEVLPAIRETGRYESALSPDPSPARGRGEMTVSIEAWDDAQDEIAALKNERLELLQEVRELYRDKVDWLEARSGLTPKRRNLTADERTAIVLLHEQGLNKTAIGQRIGRSPETVATYLRQRRLEG